MTPQMTLKFNRMSKEVFFYTANETVQYAFVHISITCKTQFVHAWAIAAFYAGTASLRSSTSTSEE